MGEMNEGLYTDAKEMNKRLTADVADAKEMNKNISEELIKDSDIAENMIGLNESSEDVISLDQDLGIDVTILAPNSSLLMLSANTSLDLSDSMLLKKLKTDNSSLVKIFQSLPRKRINRILRLLNNVIGKNRNEIYVIKIIIRLLRDFRICHCQYKVSNALNLRLSRWKSIGVRLKYVSVSGNGYHIWGIALNNNIYYRAGRYRRWKRVAGKLKEIAVSGNGRFVCGVNKANYIYYRVGGYRGRWRRIPGIDAYCSIREWM